MMKQMNKIVLALVLAGTVGTMSNLQAARFFTATRIYDAIISLKKPLYTLVGGISTVKVIRWFGETDKEVVNRRFWKKFALKKFVLEAGRIPSAVSSCSEPTRFHKSIERLEDKLDQDNSKKFYEDCDRRYLRIIE